MSYYLYNLMCCLDFIKLTAHFFYARIILSLKFALYGFRMWMNT